MKVSGEFESRFGSKVQLADTRAGGNSSWGEKSGNGESSIRLAWYNENGGFDPISSAELPLWGLMELIERAAKSDMLSKPELAEIVGYLTASIYRRS